MKRNSVWLTGASSRRYRDAEQLLPIALEVFGCGVYDCRDQNRSCLAKYPEARGYISPAAHEVLELQPQCFYHEDVSPVASALTTFNLASKVKVFLLSV